MSNENHLTQSSLSGMLGRSMLNEEELDALRSRAWHEQGLLIIHPLDHRLSSVETRLLFRLGGSLFGKRGQ